MTTVSFDYIQDEYKTLSIKIVRDDASVWRRAFEPGQIEDIEALILELGMDPETVCSEIRSLWDEQTLAKYAQHIDTLTKEQEINDVKVEIAGAEIEAYKEYDIRIIVASINDVK